MVDTSSSPTPNGTITTTDTFPTYSNSQFDDHAPNPSLDLQSSKNVIVPTSQYVSDSYDWNLSSEERTRKSRKQRQEQWAQWAKEYQDQMKGSLKRKKPIFNDSVNPSSFTASQLISPSTAWKTDVWPPPHVTPPFRTRKPSLQVDRVSPSLASDMNGPASSSPISQLLSGPYDDESPCKTSSEKSGHDRPYIIISLPPSLLKGSPPPSPRRTCSGNGTHSNSEFVSQTAGVLIKRTPRQLDLTNYFSGGRVAAQASAAAQAAARMLTYPSRSPVVFLIGTEDTADLS
jgi:hypothetical protein